MDTISVPAERVFIFWRKSRTTKLLLLSGWLLLVWVHLPHIYFSVSDVFRYSLYYLPHRYWTILPVVSKLLWTNNESFCKRCINLILSWHVGRNIISVWRVMKAQVWTTFLFIVNNLKVIERFFIMLTFSVAYFTSLPLTPGSLIRKQRRYGG
jgi:hypothetical protein